MLRRVAVAAEAVCNGQAEQRLAAPRPGSYERGNYTAVGLANLCNAFHQLSADASNLEPLGIFAEGSR